MAKAKRNSMAEAVEATASVEKQPVASQEMVQKEVIVCAYEGTEAVVEAVWKKMYNGGFHLVTVSEEVSVDSLLVEMIADDTVAERFVLVPANIIPCSPVTKEELMLNYLYITAKGEPQYDARLPLFVEKMVAAELLADSEVPDVLKALKTKSRPFDVSFNFGNFITPVLRANPCEHIVLEALVRKRFISANKEGFLAIEELINSTLLK